MRKQWECALQASNHSSLMNQRSQLLCSEIHYQVVISGWGYWGRSNLGSHRTPLKNNCTSRIHHQLHQTFLRLHHCLRGIPPVFLSSLLHLCSSLHFSLTGLPALPRTLSIFFHRHFFWQNPYTFNTILVFTFQRTWNNF